MAAALALLAPAARLSAADRSDHSPDPSAVESAAVDVVGYKTIITSNNLVAMTLSNYGFYGNNFTSRKASLEYPTGLGIEHLVRGGLWVGAHSTFGGDEFDGVSTGTLDGTTNTSGQQFTEFTPAGADFLLRSILPLDPTFNKNAVSEQDIISSFNDFPKVQAPGNREDSHPLGVTITQENYSWSFSDYANILFFHFKVTNTGPLITNLWVGFYAEFASGSKNGYVNWPPGLTDPSGSGSWFNKKLIAYDPAYHLYREHFCNAQPVPAGCQFTRAPYWIGLRYLGAKGLYEDPDRTNKNVTLTAWRWEPSNPDRLYDTQRYGIMSAGTVNPLTATDLQPADGDPVGLMAIGPFPRVYTDSTVTVDFAIVGAPDIPPLQSTSDLAQRAYDLNYVVPIPPPSPRFQVVARDNALDYYWDDSPESFEDPTSPGNHIDFEGYRLYLGETRDKLLQIAQFDSNVSPGDTVGFNTGFTAVTLNPPARINGHDYKYRYSVNGVRDGFKYFCAVTSFDRGNTLIESLESGQTQNMILAVPAPTKDERTEFGPTVFPNPYRVEARWDRDRKIRDHYLWFTRLPAKCELKILTLSGDLLLQKEFDGSTYGGEGTRGLYNPAQDAPLAPPSLSGTTFAWDLITRQGAAVASGLYLFTVEDRATGKRTVGKFLIVKSDRE
jgi:hypothetical protein